MTRPALALLTAATCLHCFPVVTKATARPASPTRILMIGDSLSVGAFGETVQRHLARKYGPQNVAAYASCGSSPEHWLAAEPPFYTPCGYRESTPDKMPVFRDFVNGKLPRPVRTPKLEALVRRHRPTIVVAQLGTNWMDRDLSDAQISSFLDRFISAARGASARQIIWIAPPDSSSMASKAQARVHRLIAQGAKRDRYEVIDSRQLTRYVPGKTGSDGVHYNSEAARAWAARINTSLDARLRGQLARNR